MTEPAARPRVMLAFTLYGHVAPKCTLSMLKTTAEGVATGLVAGVDGSVNMFLDFARNDMCQKALDRGASHIWFVDQDMVIPADALPTLLARDKPVVGGLYYTANEYDPVVFDLNPLRRWTEVPDDLGPGVIQVGGIGLGCVLIRTDVLRTLAEYSDSPDFFSSERTGEDLHFAKRCARWSIPIYLDPTVECGHIKDEVVTGAHHRAMVQRRATIRE